MRARRTTALTLGILLLCLAACDDDDTFGPPLFDLTLGIRSFNPHVGQLFEVRVVDRGTGLEVARQRVAPIASPDFDLYFDEVLIQGRDYNVDFYADANDSGGYDAPPVDHAWRLPVTEVRGDISLVFPHDFVWTDIQFP